jgi:YD repeat-containing protein
MAAKNKCLAQINKSGTAGKTTKKRNRLRQRVAATASVSRPHPSGENAMDDMSWRQRGLVLLSILAMTLIGLAINKAPAGEQIRFYGPDGRTIGTATTSGNTTTFYGADGRRTGSATATGIKR